MRLLALLLSVPIHLYRWTLRRALPPVCRFHPSCSAYGLEALKVHGPFTGTALVVGRLFRCHPFHPGGLDPVPPRVEHRPAVLAVPTLER